LTNEMGYIRKGALRRKKALRLAGDSEGSDKRSLKKEKGYATQEWSRQNLK